jgi:hypothetical protein
MEKYIEVKSLMGDKYLIPLNSILHIEILSGGNVYINFKNSKYLTIKESELTIREMLKYHKVEIIGENELNIFYEGFRDSQIDIDDYKPL